jgi:UDP-N-acetyl-D-mannosaminuronic acid dehydrogenase
MNPISHICCFENSTLVDVLNIYEIANNYSLPSGIALIIDSDTQSLLGTITEGDMRRSLLQNNNLKISALEVMNKNPIIFNESLSISEIINNLPIELLKRKRRSNKFLGKVVIVNDNKQPIRVLNYHELLEQRFALHRNIVILGMGYVGLTLALVMADAGFTVTGVEVDESKYNKLNNGESYIHEQGLPDLLKEQINKNLSFSKEIPENSDVYIITVGTPIKNKDDSNKLPELEFLSNSCFEIGKKLKQGNLVILRSTVPIGTSRNLVKKILEEVSNLKCGFDFHLSFAPERTAEGKAIKELRSLPQIIGGFNKDSLEATAALFRDLTPMIVKVDTLEAAEMAKLINNSFRDYVFAFSNQCAKIANEFNIDIFKTIKAANDGYVRDPIPYPSPGVGGPCLTKDPFILASVAIKKDINGEIFKNSRLVNESMFGFVFEKIKLQVKNIGKDLNKCNILICGLAFKGYPETSDLRNSTAIEIANIFKGKVNKLFGHDPIANDEDIIQNGLIPVKIPEGFKNIDIVLFLNNHKNFEKINVFEMIRSMNDLPIVFDGWNIFYSEDILSAKPSIYIGLSHLETSII